MALEAREMWQVVKDKVFLLCMQEYVTAESQHPHKNLSALLSTCVLLQEEDKQSPGAQRQSRFSQISQK